MVPNYIIIYKTKDIGENFTVAQLEFENFHTYPRNNPNIFIKVSDYYRLYYVWCENDEIFNDCMTLLNMGDYHGIFLERELLETFTPSQISTFDNILKEKTKYLETGFGCGVQLI